MLKLIFLFEFICLNAFSQVNVLRLDQLTTRDGLPHNSVQSIWQDKYGFMWFSSFAGLSKYDGYKFTSYLSDPNDQKSLFSRSIYNLLPDSAENLWISFFDTSVYCRYNYETDDFSRFQSNELDRQFIQQMNRNRYPATIAYNNPEVEWQFIDNCLIKTDINSGDICRYFIVLPQNQTLSADIIKTMYLDDSGTLWIGTENQGIYKTNTYTKPFYTYNFGNRSKPDVINEIVRSIYLDTDSVLWIGTHFHGIIKLNLRNNRVSTLKMNADNRENSLINNQVRKIFKDRYGIFWIGTKGGLSKYYPVTNTFENFTRYTPVRIPHPWVHSIIEDHRGELWISTFYGIARYDRDKEQFVWIDAVKTLKNSRVSYIIEDKGHNIWVATQGGGVTCLQRTDTPDIFRPVHYLNDPDNENSISSNRTFSLLEDEEGYIWIGTDFGLNRLDPKTGSFIRIVPTNGGIPDELIMGIMEDKSGNIWISHKKGLSRLNKKNLKTRNFTEQDGLRSNDFSENAFFADPVSGQMFFGSSSGLNSFYPDSIKDNFYKPRPVFTELQVLNQVVKPGKEINGKAVLTKPLLFTKEIKLNHTHKSFTVQFASLDFTNPSANKYKYMLEGFDEAWIERDASMRFATYSNLSPGKYVLSVMVSNDDGIWNPEPLSLNITITPPLWRTTWAVVLYVLFFCAVCYWVYLYIVSRERLKTRIRYEQMKAKKIEELDQMKLQFFTNVSHELRTPLSLIIDPLKKISSGKVDPSKLDYYYAIMHRNAQRLMNLVNQLLDFRKAGSKKTPLETSRADLAAFIGNVADAFRINAMHRNINFTYRANPSVLPAVFDSDKLEKILFNLLSNAFKYTLDGGIITLSLKVPGYSEHNCPGMIETVIEVADNGIGIPVNALHKIFDLFYQAAPPEGFTNYGTGIGLALTKELVEQLHGKITVSSNPDQGTAFTITLPIELIAEKEIKPVEPAYIDSSNSTPPENEIINQSFAGHKDALVNSEKLILLIVEDNPDVRTYLKGELEEMFTVIEAPDGEKGWFSAVEMVPDIIICDIMMPGIDGLELCRRVKTDMRTSHIPVIILTARHSETYIIDGYETGADAYITKPFSTAVLIARIKNLIESRKRLSGFFGKMPFIDIKKIAGNTSDEHFLKKTLKIIEDNISEPDFNINLIADHLKINRRQLTRKIKMLTGQTVHEFVQTIRLNKAAELLLTTEYSVSEIAFRLGYNVPANFTRSFSKQFGKSPTDYISSLLDKKTL
ncbi:MAG: response regulator [Bacteroidales bacterium]|nr:response regulator [Bacteroidales bacterium]